MLIDQNELYRGVTSRICGNLDYTDALKRTDKFLRSVFPHDMMTMLVLHGDFEILEIIATTARGFPLEQSTEIPLTPESREILEKGVFGHRKDGDIVSINNRGVDTAIHKDAMNVITRDSKTFGTYAETMLADMNKQSVLVLRLDISDTTIGFMSLNSDGFNVFSKEHAKLLTSLAEPFAIALSNHLRYREIVRLRDILDDNQKNLQKDLIRISGDQVVGAENGLRDVMDHAKMVAGINSPVLILGETGVGKEVVANAIHQISDRREGPMISVNCGAIPETLADSELFGHEKGAFTGATGRKRGYFERADGGTIFLDEIGELSPSSQVKLLRFIQTRVFERVGGTKPVSVDIRIITATHRNLEKMIEEGTFRKDLWFRLNVFPIQIPPLRDRKQDIPALVEYLITRKSHEMNLQHKPVIAKGALEALVDYDWPGNVRELQNIVERALIISWGEQVDFDLPGKKAPLTSVSKPQMIQITENPRFEDILPLNDTIKTAIELALKTTHGRIEGPFGASTLLDLPPSTLKNKMKKLGISRLGNMTH
jgi:transcriptional regulator with GAF, ATPase, and Fis domain